MERIQQLIDEELTHRKAEWGRLVEIGEMDKTTANERWSLLHDIGLALRKEPVKYRKPDTQVSVYYALMYQELKRWAREAGKRWGDAVTSGEMTKHDFTHRMKALIALDEYLFRTESQAHEFSQPIKADA